VAAKSGRLTKVAKLLEKIAATLRRIGPEAKFLDKGHDAAEAAVKVEKRAAKAARRHGVPDIESPKAIKKIEQKSLEEYNTAHKSVGPKRTKPGLHNQEWDEVKVEKFKARRSVDLDNLSPNEKAAAKALEKQGWKDNKIEEILSSGDNFTTKELKQGDKLYGFSSAGRGKDIKTSAYWLDEAGYQDVKSKYCTDGVWDKEGVKGYLALPCYNRADAIDVAEVTQTTTAVESKIGRATELVQYGNKSGSNTGLIGKIMGGGGNQVTVDPSAVKALPGM
jgi:hypothetical protein